MSFAIRNTPRPGDGQLAVPGARLRYRDEGSGEPVVLLHGWALDLSIWDALAGLLVRRHRVIRVDRRGFGESTGRPDLTADVGDLRALLDHLGLDRAAVVGMSQAARVALRFALEYHDRISRLVIDGAPADSAEIPIARLRELLRTRGMEAVRRQLLAHPLLQLRSADAGARRSLEAMIERYPGLDLRDAHGPAPQASVAQLASLRLPVLILTGEHDTLPRRRRAETLQAVIPGSIRRIVPGAGHLAALDCPDAYATLLLDFLHPPSGA